MDIKKRNTTNRDVLKTVPHDRRSLQKMKKVLAIFILVVFSFVNGCVSTDNQRNLELAISDSIHLLKNKEYHKFLKKYMEPKLRKELKNEITLQDFSIQFSQEMGPKLLEKLKLIRNKTPEFNNEMNIAKFYYPSPKANRHPEYHYIPFIKINGQWYLKGK